MFLDGRGAARHRLATLAAAACSLAGAGFGNEPVLYTLLSKPGKYFVRVADCNVVFGPENCAAPDGIENFDYTLSGGFLSGEGKSVALESSDDNDTPAKALDLTAKYEPTTTAGTYFLTTVLGVLNAAGASDYYKIKLPSDVTVPAGSGALVSFYVLPSGATGSGSTAVAASYELHDGATDAVIASIAVTDADQTGRELSVPVTLGTDYYLVVKAPAGTLGDNPFYVVNELAGSGNPLEKSEADNDDPAKAEVLTASASQPTSFFVEGTLATKADLDHFSITVPAGLADKTVAVSCGGERSGSGVRGLRATVLDGATSVATATETASKDLTVAATAFPAAATKLTIKLDATLDPSDDVSSRYYRCGIHFN